VFTNYGEWAGSNLLFGLVFLAAAIAVTGIGYWVVRHDRLNRIDEVTTDPGDDQPREAH
jgi:Tfp pilus assembly protein PilO